MIGGESRIRREIRWAMLPYGFWICDGGRKVVFNRHYRAIWPWDRDGLVSIADSDKFVAWSQEGHFYPDAMIGKVQRAIRAFEVFTCQRWDWDVARFEFRNIDQKLCRPIRSDRSRGDKFTSSTERRKRLRKTFRR